MALCEVCHAKLYLNNRIGVCSKTAACRAESYRRTYTKKMVSNKDVFVLVLGLIPTLPSKVAWELANRLSEHERHALLNDWVQGANRRL
jgi:hypothetical protein